MGLFLICPHCHAKLPLTCRTCPGCGADLQRLLASERHYFIGTPEAPAAPAPETMPAPFPETIEAEFVETFPEAYAGEVPEAFPQMSEAIVAEPYPVPRLPETPTLDKQDVSLCEALDRILNKGAVLFGEVMISVADIDLVYLGLQVILASMETAQGLKPAFETAGAGPNIFAKGAFS